MTKTNPLMEHGETRLQFLAECRAQLLQERKIAIATKDKTRLASVTRRLKIANERLTLETLKH